VQFSVVGIGGKMDGRWGGSEGGRQADGERKIRRNREEIGRNGAKMVGVEGE